MTSILVICTGNICRSPMAEGLLRSVLDRRFAKAAPAVSSAGTIAQKGADPMPESVEAARELGVDIAEHRGRRLTVRMAEEADLLLCMAIEHRAALEGEPGLGPRAFTLKELVRLLEILPHPDPDAGPDGLTARVAAADLARREGAVPVSMDEEIADPLGQPFEAYRAVAWEIETWIDRLVDGLFGAVSGADAVAEGR